MDVANGAELDYIGADFNIWDLEPAPDEAFLFLGIGESDSSGVSPSPTGSLLPIPRVILFGIV